MDPGLRRDDAYWVTKFLVVPAFAGMTVYCVRRPREGGDPAPFGDHFNNRHWVPAFAGMTNEYSSAVRRNRRANRLALAVAIRPARSRRRLHHRDH